MNNFASYYYAEMLVVAVGKKKKDLILIKSKEKNETIFLMYLFPLRYKWHSKWLKILFNHLPSSQTNNLGIIIDFSFI